MIGEIRCILNAHWSNRNTTFFHFVHNAKLNLKSRNKWCRPLNTLGSTNVGNNRQYNHICWWKKKEEKRKMKKKNGCHSNAAQQNSYHGFTCTLDPRRLPGDANCYQDNKTQSEHT